MTEPLASAYLELREQIEGLLTEGRQHRRQAGEAEKVGTYWHMGDALVRHFLSHPDAAYGDQVVRNLSKDLQLGASTLYEILRFRRLLPAFSARRELSWSHYRTLIHLPDTDLYLHYERLAAERGWSTRQLKQAVEADHPDLGLAPNAESTPLRARFGQLATYRVVEDPLDPGGPPAIDLGFHQLWVPTTLPGFGKARPGDTVTLSETRAGSPRARLLTGRPRPWTYIARRLRVIDGDTLEVVVDLGLGHRARPRLRLRGIDCPELYTHAGRTARAFVECALAPVDFAVITTWRTDTYGRYLADLRYLPGQPDARIVLARGTYLNRQLLDRQLAVRYLD